MFKERMKKEDMDIESTCTKNILIETSNARILTVVLG